MSQFDCSSTDFEKLVHFDLKGAPPVIGYYEQIFPLLKKLGATGILMEYEDMFPYQGDLQIVCQPDVYSAEEIQKIQNLAIENDLQIIPLVQSFGHLEFLLKHDKYYEIREIERYPNALCPSHSKSEGVIMDMINQILDSHKSSKYIHIEVMRFGTLDSALDVKEKWGSEMEERTSILRSYHSYCPKNS
ncbi:hypothetical protein CDAR_546991 [Caerostris darwini]|uniref:Beta-N-acetylhexosaminidase n=1 Tax=Caerostris darwini TaxID=1538125 RepID=A0AAV4S7X9_9ARAC|nr:hypothetical protein CDAR_546991 [Caerostris darwini]